MPQEASIKQENEQPSGHGGVSWITIAALIPVLYVLSIGPVARICDNAGGPFPFLDKFYFPLIWLYDHTVLKKPLDAYVKLWGVS